MRWVTYFPEIHNIHLTKDLGLIPHYMGASEGFDSEIVGYFPDQDYPALEREMKGLKVKKLSNQGNWMFVGKAAIQYLKRESKLIDVLNLYHLSRHTLVYGLAYKYYNPNGKLYLKLDAYNSHLTEPKRYAKSAFKNNIFRFLEKRFLAKVDLISVENQTGLELAKKQYPNITQKIHYIPNGCNDLYLKAHFDSISPKENIILSVGRMGGEDKNYELVLQALPYLKLNGWKMILVGPMTESFENKWKAELAKNPSLSEVVSFVGPIYDRESLYRLYQKSKVFFLPSRFESFGISYVEALYFGSVLIGHKGMSAYDDLTQNGAFGTYYQDNDAESFSRAISEAVQLSEKDGITDEIQLHAKKYFYWSSIAKNISSLLKNG